MTFKNSRGESWMLDYTCGQQQKNERVVRGMPLPMLVCVTLLSSVKGSPERWRKPEEVKENRS